MLDIILRSRQLIGVFSNQEHQSTTSINTFSNIVNDFDNLSDKLKQGYYDLIPTKRHFRNPNGVPRTLNYHYFRSHQKGVLI